MAKGKGNSGVIPGVIGVSSKKASTPAPAKNGEAMPSKQINPFIAGAGGKVKTK